MKQQRMACNLWFGLFAAQILIGGLRLINVIHWHWAIVMIPTWVFLALPAISYFGVYLIEKFWPD